MCACVQLYDKGIPVLISPYLLLELLYRISTVPHISCLERDLPQPQSGFIKMEKFYD